MLLELEDEAEHIGYEHHVLSYTHLSLHYAKPAGYPIEAVEEAIENNKSTLQRMAEAVADDGTVVSGPVCDDLDDLLRENLFLSPIETA